MNIPALINVDYDQTMDGCLAIVDGKDGQLIIDPTKEILEKYRAMQQAENEKLLLLRELKGRETVTKSGRCFVPVLMVILQLCIQ